ncbi:TetR family transcriptional regulator [Mycobacterium uberis]|uniref:TetR family transcriptional regulator n=1 Tax=Mycobacterium uberis TaxID=2162698 RepID=A0A3E1HF05_9MYCO|nr:TetR/AcrR family transcriptional regulator [Mycobacterium uberis]RFD25038.1 TetR family transcriptional regulator [Mycobacterium uberis]
MTAPTLDGQPGPPETPDRRSQLKSGRRLQPLSAAERLFAERGFLAVPLEDSGAAAEVSGPAIYRHFPNKKSLLVETSARLLAGARDANVALDGLIDFHLDFALGKPHLIRIQDRDLVYLPTVAARQVRKAQRQYVEVWVAVLRQLNPKLAEANAWLAAHAVLSVLNSTLYSMKSLGNSRAKPSSAERFGAIMRTMTVAVLVAVDLHNA